MAGETYPVLPDTVPVPEARPSVAPVAAKPWERAWTAPVQAAAKPWERKWQAPAKAEEPGMLDGAANLAKGLGERVVKLEGGAVRGIATALPGSDPVSDFIYWATGREKPANYPTPEEVTKTGQEVAKQLENVDLGFDEGDTWEDVKKAPVSKFLPWAMKQGLLSTPDMAAAMASLPAYAAIRSGELGQQRAQNDQRQDATVEDMLTTAPAAVVSGLLDRIGGRGMFGLDDVAIQSIKQVPKEVGKAAVKEGLTESAQEVVESVGTTAGTKTGFDPARTAEQAAAAGLAGGVFGGAVRGAETPIELARVNIGPKVSPEQGNTGETVETVDPPDQAPVTQDASGVTESPPGSPLASPEARAILRRTSIPDADIDAMSPEEIEAKVAEARDAGIKINGAMVKAAEQYRPQIAQDAQTVQPAPQVIQQPETAPVALPDGQNAPIPAQRPDPQAIAAEKLQQYRQKQQQIDQAVAPVLPELEQTTTAAVAEDQQAAQKVDQTLDAPLKATVIRSLYEDRQPPQQIDNRTVQQKAADMRRQYEAKQQDLNRAVDRVQPELEQTVQQGISGDHQEDAKIDQALGAPLKSQVMRSVYEDRQSIPMNGNTSNGELRTERDARALKNARIQRLDKDEAAMLQPERQGLSSVRSVGNIGVPEVGDGLQGILQPRRPAPVAGVFDRSDRRNQGVLPGQRSMGDGQATVGEPSGVGQKLGREDGSLQGRGTRDPSTNSLQPNSLRDDNGAGDNSRPAEVRIRSENLSPVPGANAINPRTGEDVERLSRGTQRAAAPGLVTGTSDGKASGPLSSGRKNGAFPTTRDGRIKKPDSLIEFLSRKGGVREDRGELSALGLRDRKSGFVVGAGPLIRRNGMHPDKAREAAAEAGYLPDDSSLADFYDALDLDARTARTKFSDYDADWAEAWRDEQGGEARKAEEEAAEASAYENYRQSEASPEESRRQAVYAQLVEEDYAGTLGDDFSQRVARFVLAGETFEDAVSYAYDEMRADVLANTPGLPDIPFFGDEENEAFAGTATEGSPFDEAGDPESNDAGSEGEAGRTGDSSPVRSEDRATDDGDGGREDGERSDRESPDQRKEPVVEPGADNKPQLVIPGAEKATDADMAQRKADAPLKPKAPQKDPGGLFSDEMDQKDLLDFSLNVEDNLIAQHNLSAPNLLFSKKMGGIAVPSVAISNVDYPMTGFGEITLLGEKDLVDPKRDSTTKVFDADVYSPRYPTVRYKIATPEWRKAWKRMDAASRDLGHVLSSELDNGELERKGLEAFQDSTAAQLQFLRETGKDFELPKAAPDADAYRARWDARYAVRDEARKYPDEYAAWVRDNFSNIFSGESIISETASGNLKYFPHNLDNVVKVMRKKLQDGEGFNYGVGSIRSTIAHKFSSIAAIKKARGRVVSHDVMEKIKDETDKELMALAEKVQEFTSQKGFGFLDSFSENLKEVAQRNVNVLQRYYPGITPEVKQDVVTFLDKLANLPTEYFEAKLQRAVPISDFKIAIIPAKSTADVRKALSDSGVRIFEYDGTREDRAKVTRQAAQEAEILFSTNAPSGRGSIDPGEAPRLTEKEQADLADIVRKTSGLDPTFVESIPVPAGTPGLEAWGRTGPATASGYYQFSQDAIVLALDSADRATAYHESFHRLQNKFIDAATKKLLKANSQQLRQIIADNDYRGAETASKMSQREVEAEAFAIWSDAMDKGEAVKVHIGIRKPWMKIRDFLRRLGNYLRGRGFQTYEDVFGKAWSGETAKQGKTENEDSDTAFSIVERAPDTPQPVKEREELATGIKGYLSDLSKATAKSVKQKGTRFDKATAENGETLRDYMRRKLVDSLDPVKRMQDAVGAKPNDLANIYLNARLAEGTKRYEVEQVYEKYINPAIDELAAVGATNDELSKFMYAMHAPERNRETGLRNDPESDFYKAVTDPDIKGASGISTNTAKAWIKELAADREKFLGIRRAAAHIRAMLDNSLAIDLKAGLIDKATHERLTKQWQNYVPLHAEADTDGMTGGGFPSKSRGFDVRGDEFKGATGRFSEADNVVIYAIQSAQNAALRVESNQVATAALRFINEFDPNGEKIAQVYWSEEPDQLEDITKAPAVYKRVIGADGKVTSKKVNDFQLRDDVLAAKVGGKVYYMRFADPNVGLSLKKMTKAEMGVFLKVIGKVSQWQSLINTRANPAFIPINLIRDVQTGALLSLTKGFTVSEAARTVGRVPSAWGALWRQARGWEAKTEWDSHLQDFMKAGGKISFDQYDTIEGTVKRIQKEFSKRNDRGMVMKSWTSFKKLIEDLNGTIENGMRLAVFERNMRKGATKKQSAFLARDLTVDFNKSGDLGPSMNALYTFFNASVQGNYNFAKALRNKKIQAGMAVLVGAGFAAHLYNLYAAGDDDDGENAYLKMLRNEPWKFERNMIFFIKGRKDYISIPLGFGLNAFWHLGVQGGALTTGDKNFLPVMMDSTRVAFDAFNPLGSGSWVAMALPSVIDPIWELGTNENFSGNPIYPEENQFDQSPPPKSEQAFGSTSPAFRWGAEMLNTLTGGNDIEPGMIDVYPDAIEHLWGWFTGGVGRFASQTVETATRAADLEFVPEKTPWVRSIYGKVAEDSRRSEYFREREKVQWAKGKLKEYQDAGNEEDIADFVDRHKQEVNAISVFDAAEKQRRKLNKMRRQAEKSDGATVKSDLEQLEKDEADIMNEARKAFFEAGKQ